MKTRELVVIGGGPAGMAAAISAHRCGVKDILILERDQYLGGILNQCIHTGFGLEYFKEILTGPEYAQRFIDQIREIDQIEISLKSFVVDLTPDKKISYLKPGALEQISAKAVILATGCRERTREMAHIPGTRPSGIYPAGLAQKMVNVEGWIPGKNIVIVGSGDIGLIMARRFTLEGCNVKAIIEISNQSKGLIRNIVQCVEDFNIPLFFRHKISKILGRDRVEAVEVVKVDDELNEIKDSLFKIECDTIVMSIGLIPENELLEGAGALIDRTTNSPISPELNKTSIPGIFACGNCFKVYDIVDSVTRDSFLAGEMAAKYLSGEGC